MFLLVPAHLICPGENPESCKMVVCVCVCVCVRACVRACMHACGACVRACVRACLNAGISIRLCEGSAVNL